MTNNFNDINNSKKNNNTNSNGNNDDSNKGMKLLSFMIK